MSPKKKLHRCETLMESTIEEHPPTYEESVSSWSPMKTIAIVGFILFQVVIFSAVLNELVRNTLVYNIVPEQIHLSLGRNDKEYIVSWATMSPTNCHLIWQREGSPIANSVQATMDETLFEDRSEDTKKLFASNITSSETTYRRYFYHAKMIVTPGSSYSYYITSTKKKSPDDNNDGTEKETVYSSERYHITAIPYEDNDRDLNAIFFGDLGLKNARSVPRLTEEVSSYKYDLLIHNGDFAYDLNTKRGKYGDEFMRLIEPIAARIPYQTSVGNHEVWGNFSHYDNRFRMINRGPVNFGKSNNFYYSYNAGPIHFVAFSTEFYYFLEYVSLAPLIAQYEWLKADLEAASRPAARLKRPWIIVYGHRPMYCSSRDNDDCSKDSNILRRGLPVTGGFALEKLFYNYGVDVELYSHEHQYERFLPIYDGKVYNGTDEVDDPYFNPRAPVHLISGSAGCQEKLDPFEGHPVTGSVMQISDYGFTRIHATRCKIKFEQISDDQAGTIVDKFTITKNRQSFPHKASQQIYNDCP